MLERPRDRWCAAHPEPSLGGGGFTMLLVALLVVAVLLVAYLLYALVNPEAFQ
jgi:K+-transporting ATPase KdpF subunit